MYYCFEIQYPNTYLKFVVYDLCNKLIINKLVRLRDLNLLQITGFYIINHRLNNIRTTFDFVVLKFKLFTVETTFFCMFNNFFFFY